MVGEPPGPVYVSGPYLCMGCLFGGVVSGWTLLKEVGDNEYQPTEKIIVHGASHPMKIMNPTLIRNIHAVDKRR